MIELSRRMPRDPAGLAKIRGLEPGQIRREGETLTRLIDEAASLPREEWPVDRQRAKPLSPQQEALVDLLSAGLRLIAEQHQLSPLAIASRRDLEKLVLGDQDTPLNEGWRSSLAGDRLRALMQGTQRLLVSDGVVQLDSGAGAA
jgi:ribonuclease D